MTNLIDHIDRIRDFVQQREEWAASRRRGEWVLCYPCSRGRHTTPCIGAEDPSVRCDCLSCNDPEVAA